MESTIRGQVNGQTFQTIWRRLSAGDRARIEALLVVGPGGKSDLDRLKKPARRASWSKFKEQATHLAWVEGVCDTEEVLEGIAASKVADFAGEADAADADVLARKPRHSWWSRTSRRTSRSPKMTPVMRRHERSVGKLPDAAIDAQHGARGVGGLLRGEIDGCLRQFGGGP
ncbi:hypothetical protein SAMN05444920_102231 [Nonomuraea solani]|uniref:Uncharacterized protein n=1 Tax=Nonomuraea solani TaxID=1144553 RepID=A0A1H5YDM6_9ACTN|nr:hypothetical protein [Nonomuraea solani]SEG21750.1 hypothetical protein SAMN05444920_102231 [Nonomuraea solani]